MDLRKLKTKMLATAAVALVAIGVSTTVDAQQVFNVTFGTAAGIVTAAGTDLDFGTWAQNITDGETLTITIPPTLGGGAPALPVPALTVAGGTALQQSLMTNTVAPASSGTITVTVPTNATTVQISGSVTTPFADPSLLLNNLRYQSFTEAAAALPVAFTGGVVVTCVTGATPEEVAIGGDLVISGVLADATVYGPAVITVNFQYGA
ncbi:hypothetical protein N9Z27_02290 [Alphaproteobacteria bacterium]|nr:hypothetical protein [Alphaproteobacteria bacterium]